MFTIFSKLITHKINLSFVAKSLIIFDIIFGNHIFYGRYIFILFGFYRSIFNKELFYDNYPYIFLYSHA